eukprot:265336-Prorocentrum_minimum.AAC.2
MALGRSALTVASPRAKTQTKKQLRNATRRSAWEVRTRLGTCGCSRARGCGCVCHLSGGGWAAGSMRTSHGRQDGDIHGTSGEGWKDFRAYRVVRV